MLNCLILVIKENVFVFSKYNLRYLGVHDVTTYSRIIQKKMCMCACVYVPEREKGNGQNVGISYIILATFL